MGRADVNTFACHTTEALMVMWIMCCADHWCARSCSFPCWPSATAMLCASRCASRRSPPCGPTYACSLLCYAQHSAATLAVAGASLLALPVPETQVCVGGSRRGGALYCMELAVMRMCFQHHPVRRSSCGAAFVGGCCFPLAGKFSHVALGSFRQCGIFVAEVVEPWAPRPSSVRYLSEPRAS